jgi:hypothetical protein
MSTKNQFGLSRDIPAPIAREIRQRCGFGCVICGLPLYEYEHLLGFTNAGSHIADEITLLCDLHHREKTAGLLPLSKVEEANKNPYNLKAGVKTPNNLHYCGNECEFIVGNNSFSMIADSDGTVVVPISVDDTQLLGFTLEKGHFLLNLSVFDEYNRQVLEIKDNQLFYSLIPWDIELVGRNLIVRAAEREILLDVTFETPNRVEIRRGRFLRNGVEVLVKPNGIEVVNNGMKYSGSTARNRSGGILIGPHTRPINSLIAMPEVSRYKHGKL